MPFLALSIPNWFRYIRYFVSNQTENIVVERKINGLNVLTHVSPILPCGTVDDREAAGDEVVLDVDDEEGGHGAHDLQINSVFHVKV